MTDSAMALALFHHEDTGPATVLEGQNGWGILCFAKQNGHMFKENVSCDEALQLMEDEIIDELYKQKVPEHTYTEKRMRHDMRVRKQIPNELLPPFRVRKRDKGLHLNQLLQMLPDNLTQWLAQQTPPVVYFYAVRPHGSGGLGPPRMYVTAYHKNVAEVEHDGQQKVDTRAFGELVGEGWIAFDENIDSSALVKPYVHTSTCTDDGESDSDSDSNSKSEFMYKIQDNLCCV